MNRLENTSTPMAVALAIVGYSLCSSTLLLANKMAIYYLPNPSVVSFIQIVFAAFVVLGLKMGGVKVDDFQADKMKAYALYIAIFVGAIYTNMLALSNSNVETVIVFRACSPISVSLLEWYYMGRQLPNMRSTISLAIIAIGALIYCLCDSEFALHGISAYLWVVIYFFLITVEMTYGKQLTSAVQMDSVWGPVLYCNALAIMPMFLLGSVSPNFFEGPQMIASLDFTGMSILIFSCIAGTLIGYTGWLCRGMTSATTFTLVGVVNKFLTVLLNVFIWDKHSTPMGTFAVCICLLAGFFYQQAPRRDAIKHEAVIDEQKTELIDKSKNSADVSGNISSDSDESIELGDTSNIGITKTPNH